MNYFRRNINEAAGYTPGFQPKADNIVKLNTNENPYSPSPAVMEAIARLTPEQLRRYPDPMGDSFRRTAGQLNGVSPESVMCCNGGDDLLNIAIRAFCDETRPLAYPVPTYSLYPVLAKIQNCPVVEVPFTPALQLPEMLSQTGSPLTIVCNPNAPTGSLIQPKDLGILADTLDGILLIDEAYVDFAPCHCVDLIRQFDNVILLRSMSKGYSLAGIRFGYAMANPELIAGLMKIKDSYNVDAVSIAVATAALEDQACFQDHIDQIKLNRANLTRELQHLGFDVPESHTNFVLAQSNGKPAATLYEALAEKNIFVRYFSLPGLDDKLRISVGTPEQNRQLVCALKEIVS